MALPASPITPRRLSVGLYALTVALAGATAVLVAGALRSPGPRAPLTASLALPKTVQTGGAVKAESAEVYQALAASAVFGAPPAQPTAAAQQPAPAEAPVNAVVVGILVHGALYRAIVEVGSGGQKLLRVGDPLVGGRIAEITLNEVVLERNGRRITLPVRPSAHARPVSSSAQPPAATPARSVALGTAKPAEPQPEESDIEAGDIQLEDFGVFYDGLKKGLLEAQAKTAHDAAGKPVGLAFDGVPEGAMPWRMGLRPGDIVTDVNDIPVSDMNSLLNAFDKVAAQVRSENESFIVIDLVRDQKADLVILTIWQ